MNDELTVEKTELVNIAFKLNEELEKSVQQQGYLYLKIGKILKTFRDEKLYKHLGDGGYDTFESFVAGSKLKAVSTAWTYIGIYEYFVDKLKMTFEQIAEIPLHQIQMILPILKRVDEEEGEEIIAKAKELSLSDLRKEMQVYRPHILERPRVYQHRECGKWRIEYKDEDMCHCDDGTGFIERNI